MQGSHRNERGVAVPPAGAKQSYPPRGYQEDLIEIAKENNVGGSSRSVDGLHFCCCCWPPALA
jgi:hypothetical protein